jgi:hypothetical protein
VLLNIISHLTFPEFDRLAQKLHLMTDSDLIAEDEFGNTYDYDRDPHPEGVPSGKPEDWFGVDWTRHS